MLMLFGILILTIPATAQQTRQDAKPIQTLPSVVVSQGYLDDSVRAFKDVKALRDANEKLLTERNLSESERVSLENINKGLNEYLSIKDKTIEAYKSLVETYQNVMKLQNDLIDKLEKKLLKPKTIWDKVMDFIKDATKVLAGVAIGMAL